MLTAVVIALFIAGLVLVVLGWRELLPSRIFLGRPTTAARELKAGPVEAAGVIRADGAPPIRSANGLACVIVHTIVEQRVGKNNYREQERETVAVPAVLTDASGSCTVSLSNVDLMGEMWELKEEPGGRRITQLVVPEGAQVLVAGVARAADQPAPGAYRGSSVRLEIGGSDETPLLLSIGGQTSAMWRYGWRALFAVFCGVLLLGLGAAAAFVRAML
jgi:hypothetical protein